MRQIRPGAAALENRLLLASGDVLDWRGNVPGNNSGANLNETQLTPGNVNPSTFGLQFSDQVDGQIYGQPLIKTGVTINGVKHDVVFVTTEHDSVYAFDADTPGPALWHVSFLTSGLPGATSITTVPSSVTGSADITPEVGITDTPVIAPTLGPDGTLFVVSKTAEVVNGTTHYVQRLHALDIGTGGEELGGPVLLGDTTFGGPDGGFTDNSPIMVPGTGDSSDGTNVHFNALRENERDGLFIDKGVLYMSFTSHGDTQPYHGWLVGYQLPTSPTGTLQLASVYNTTPNGTEGAIWMGGGSPAVDANGNIYFSTGNGTFDAGAAALGGGGGALGYQGINNSLAVTFRAYSSSSTGLGEDGNFLTPNSLSGTGIDFNGGAQSGTPHVYSATLSYDSSTQTLTESLKDTTTNAVFNTSYTGINLTSILGGSNKAFVGFTGGTGGLNMEQDVLTWTFGNGTTTTIDHSGGFASNSDLIANGNASFTNGLAQLTPAANGQAGSIFDTTAENVSNNFTTTFTFEMKAGTNPVADGMTFTLRAPGPDYAMSVEKVSSTPGANGQLPVLSFFAPHDEASLSNVDLDQGSGGVLLLPPLPNGEQLLVQTGKTGRVYLFDANNLGGFTPTDSGPLQILPDGTISGGSYDTPAYFNNGTQQLIYYMGAGDVLKSFTIANARLSTQPFAETTQAFGFPGANPMISANGTQDGIVWVLDTSNNGTGGHPGSGPAVLHAYDATTLKELYNTTLNGTLDQLGNADKFVVPTVANGHVYVATQTGLDVLGLFAPPTTVPAAPSNLRATATGPNSVVLNWTDNATNARGVKILRSDGNASDFVQIAEVSPFATTFTDTTVNPATKFFYEVVATNALGDSGPSNLVNVLTPGGPPTLQVTATGSSQVNLAWTPTAGTTFNVLRSTDGVNFSLIATVPASVTTHVDTGLSPNVYYYEVEAFDQFGGMYFSNIVQDTVGEPVVVDHSGGFASHSDLTANGNATFTNGLAQLTDGGTGEAGTIFSDQKTDIRSFTTSFTFQMHNGSSPMADGMTFIIQANNPNAIGFSGGGLGYGADHPVSQGGGVGIPNSVAIKFDLFQNVNEGDDSTGIFTDGRSPTVRDPALPATLTPLIPDESVDMTGSGIVLQSGDVFQVTLSYDGTTLNETITDETLASHPSFTTSYAVNIPGIIGGDTAFVGFGGGTGGLTTTADVQSWKFTPTTQNLAPLSPTNLKVANVEAHDANTSDVTVNWTTNSFNETGYEVWRSTDGVKFTQIATLPPNSMSFTDSKLVPGTYYYKVRAFNANGESNFTNVDSVIVGAPRSTVTVDHSTGFNSHGDLTANGSATFFPNEDPVGIFAGHMNIGNATGTTTFSNANGGTYTLTDNGGDIWNTSDNMQYVYKPLVGDGSIVARLVSANAPDFWNKMGVMIRNDLSAGSANVIMLDTPNINHQEPVMDWRDVANGGSADTDNHGTSTTPNVPTPIWLRLDRVGNTFTGYWAVDNNGTPGTWNLLQNEPNGHNTVMGNTVYVGLAIGNTSGETITGTFDHVTVTGTTAPLPPQVVQLTDGGAGEAGSVFTTSRVGVSNFNTTFTFQFTDGTSPTADGMAFVLQSDPRGPQALGGTGGGLGYGSDTAGVLAANRIVNSLAIKFDLFSNSGEGIDSTGLFANGDSPTAPTAGGNPVDTTIDLSNTGINFHSTDVFQVNLAYNGTTLTETITDKNTGATFTHNYTVDIPALLGDTVGYTGFTGGTGGLTVTADVQTWTYSFTEPAPGNSVPPAAPQSASSLTPAPATSSGSTSTSGTAQADPLAVAASASNSTPGTNNALMNLPPTSIVSNGSALSAGSSSISSGWSAFQAGVLGPIVPASVPSQLAGSMAQSPSSLDALELLFADLSNDGSLDPLATNLDETAAI